MPQPSSPFAVGDAVIDCRNPARGEGRVIRAEFDDFDDSWTFQVRFGTATFEKFAEDLQHAIHASDPWEQAAKGAFGPARALRTLLTYARIRQPPGPVGQVFGTARAKLYPYQFKPLVKFLDNPQNTLLIADEVGLGKTIEAGYILKEWKLRHKVETILILVPARLRTKWKTEMERRFMESFDLVGVREVRELLRKVKDGRELGEFQWIASYESLRRAEVTTLLREVQPPLDLLILDEAHRVRNRNTRQYDVAHALRQMASATLFLTATPVQTGEENLYTLLNLLEDGRFGTLSEFQAILAANRPILQATRLAGEGDFYGAAEALEPVSENPLTGADYSEVVASIRQELLSAEEPTREQRVRMQADIGELNLIGHVVTRTLKRDVMEHRAQRRPQSPSIPLTPNERAVYDGVAKITRLLYGTGGWGQSMATLTAYRYVASCIPAGLAYLRDRLVQDGWLSLDQEIDDELLEEEVDGGALDPELVSEVAQILRSCPTPQEDTKLSVFLTTLDTIWQEDEGAGRPHSKVVVFSFFKRTLAYLDERLDEVGYPHQLISGDVPILEREERIESFLASPDANVLLSSEVGGEGLDLQRASVVVNYDLPWNPMVVEQRIGRVDRIGQESDTIRIVNLVCDDTVESRILNRLFTRIKLFQSTIGEMEDILGPAQISALVLEFLSADLSPEEQDRRLDQTLQAVLRGQEHAQEMSREVDGILAADQAILDQLKSLVTGNRLPGPTDMMVLLKGFLENAYPGVQFEGPPMDEGVEAVRLPPEARSELGHYLQRMGANPLEQRRLVLAEMRVTSNGDVAMNRPSALFAQSRHPLIQFAVEGMQARSAQAGQCFAVELATDQVDTGTWLVGIWNVERSGEENENEIVTVACKLGTDDVVVGEAAEPIARAVLRDTRELDPRPTPDADVVKEAAGRCRRTFRGYFRELQAQYRERAEARRLRRRAVWLSAQRQRVTKLEARVRANHAEGAASFTLRMNEAKLKKARTQLDRLVQDLDVPPRVELERAHIATILAVVRQP